MKTLDEFPKLKTKRCPRCARRGVLFKDPVLNKVSRTDSRTYVCQQCGTDEALQPPETGLLARWKLERNPSWNDR